MLLQEQEDTARQAVANFLGSLFITSVRNCIYYEGPSFNNATLNQLETKVILLQKKSVADKVTVKHLEKIFVLSQGILLKCFT